MSLIKYRVREVAADLGMAPKEVADIVGKYSERPRSYSQVLTDEQLNAFFDHVTQNNQIASLEQVFAAAQKTKAEPARDAGKTARPQKPTPRQDKPGKPEAKSTEGKSAETKPAEGAPAAKQPERRRERRVVDTSAVRVNAERFDDRVDTLVLEGLRSHRVRLCRPETGRGVEVDFPGFPILALWTVPGKQAPYLCIEPWHGGPAMAGESREMRDKAYCITLDPGLSRTLSYRVRTL